VTAARVVCLPPRYQPASQRAANETTSTSVIAGR
jgi:hypothetical protein